MVLADSLHRYSLIFAGTCMVHEQHQRIGYKRMDKGWADGIWKLRLASIFWVGGLESELNLIVTINNIICFNLYPLPMLVSRLLPQIKLLYRSYALASYNNAATNSSIFNKYSSPPCRILQTRNFTDFMNLHKDNQSEFNGELFASTSKHINSLISGRDRIKFT